MEASRAVPFISFYTKIKQIYFYICQPGSLIWHFDPGHRGMLVAVRFLQNQLTQLPVADLDIPGVQFLKAQF